MLHRIFLSGQECRGLVKQCPTKLVYPLEPFIVCGLGLDDCLPRRPECNADIFLGGDKSLLCPLFQKIDLLVEVYFDRINGPYSDMRRCFSGTFLAQYPVVALGLGAHGIIGSPITPQMSFVSPRGGP